MTLRVSGMLAFAACSICCLFGAAQSLAQDAYITNYGSNTLSVVDTETDTVIGNIPVGAGLYGVAAGLNRVYATNPGLDSVLVIDPVANKVITTIVVGSGATGTCLNNVACNGIAVTPDGSKVYVGNSLSANVSVIDTATDTVATTIPLGNFSPCACSFGVAVTPDGSKVYVANDMESATVSTVSVIDTSDNTVITTITINAAEPYGVAVSPDGKKVYLANNLSNNLTVIDAATNTVTGFVPVGVNPVAFGAFIRSAAGRN